MVLNKPQVPVMLKASPNIDQSSEFSRHMLHVAYIVTGKDEAYWQTTLPGSRLQEEGATTVLSQTHRLARSGPRST